MPKRVPSIPTSPVRDRRARARERHRRPERKADKAFYDSVAWKRFRHVQLSMHPLCERCASDGLIVQAEHVHHVEARKARPDMAYDLSNVQSLCVSCHMRLERMHASDQRTA